MISLVAGFIISLSILGFALFHGRASALTYVNVEGILVVIGGTIAVLISTSRWAETKHALKLIQGLVLQKTIKNQVKQKLVATLDSIERGQIPSKTGIPFLDHSLEWYRAGIAGEDFEHLMIDGAKIEMEKNFRATQVVINLSKYPPALGMVGTVIGIIGIFSGLGTGDGQKLLGADLAVSMSSTLYGLVLANLFLGPVGELLFQGSQMEEMEITMIVDTMLMISSKNNPLLIREKINLYEAA